MNQVTIRSSRFARTALVLVLIIAAQPLQFAFGFARPLPFQGPAALVVNSVGDQPDSAIGDGHCDTDGNTANGDQCTLRAAIQEANPTPANVINFSLPPNSTIVLNTELDALTGMTINGPGAASLTIQRNTAPNTPQFRIFTVTAPAVVKMTGLTITNGRAPDATVSPNGAPGGGIHNLGVLELRDVVVIGNRAGNGRNDPALSGSGGSGGGILSQGLLTLINCVITQNRAGDGGPNSNGGDGGGVGAGFGGTIINTVISNNVAGTGGFGPGSPGGTGGRGGGLSTGNVMTIANSLITGNRSGQGGDGVAFSGAQGGDGGGISNSARMTMINTTISNNETGDGGTGTREGGLGGFGGGIHNIAPQLILANCTITGNKTNGHFGGSGGGIYSPFTGIGILKNTIVANNSVAKGGGADGQGPDLNGNFNSQDFNLLKDVSTASISGVTTHNIIGVDPKLGPLFNNGGPTLTHGLLLGSPAIDAGSNANLEVDEVDMDGDGNITEPVPFDQRGTGFPRVLNGTVDMGAVEGLSLALPPLQLALADPGAVADQLAALDSMLLLSDPFPIINPANVLNQGPDRNTRVVIFVANLSLAPNETAASVIVNLTDANNQNFDVPAEDVRAVAGVELTQVIFRLPTNLAIGTCTVKISAQGRVSNSGKIRIISQ
jgi:CSLREA domain-containing protein